MTDYYLGIEVHKTKSQVAVLDDEDLMEEEVRVVICRSELLTHREFGCGIKEVPVTS